MFHEPPFTNTEIALMLGVSVRTWQRLNRADQGPKDRTRAGLLEWIKSKERSLTKRRLRS